MREYKLGRLNGRFVVTWEEGGKRRRFRLDATTGKEAEAEALRLIDKETMPRGKTTVAGYWKAYKEYLGERPTGINMGYMESTVLDHFGAMTPDQITDAICNDFTAKRRAAGKSDGTIHTELGYLRSTLKWAEKRKLLDHAQHIERPTKPNPKERWLTRQEIERLLSVEMQAHVRLAILLMLGTAGRVGAVLDLTWDRVDFDHGWIDLRLDANGPRKGRALVPMNAMLRAALTSAKEAGLSDYVVEWGGGKVASIRKGFMAAAGRAKLPDVSPHVLRHTAAVHMVAGGIPIWKVSQYLGHSNTAITERVYARFAPEHMADAAEILNFYTVRKVQ